MIFNCQEASNLKKQKMLESNDESKDEFDLTFYDEFALEPEGECIKCLKNSIITKFYFSFPAVYVNSQGF